MLILTSYLISLEPCNQSQRALPLFIWKTRPWLWYQSKTMFDAESFLYSSSHIELIILLWNSCIIIHMRTIDSIPILLTFLPNFILILTVALNPRLPTTSRVDVDGPRPMSQISADWNLAFSLEERGRDCRRLWWESIDCGASSTLHLLKTSFFFLYDEKAMSSMCCESELRLGNLICQTTGIQTVLLSLGANLGELCQWAVMFYSGITDGRKLDAENGLCSNTLSQTALWKLKPSLMLHQVSHRPSLTTRPIILTHSRRMPK